MTNGKFARTWENTVRWFEYLKERGLDFNKYPSLKGGETPLNVSTGPTYDVHWHNYYRLNKAFKAIFPKLDFGRFLRYIFLGFKNFKSEQPLMNLVHNCITTVFNPENKPTTVRDEGEGIVYEIPTKKGEKIDLKYDICGERGRAKRLKYFKNPRPLKDFTVENMSFRVDRWESLTVGQNGDISFGGSQDCVEKGKVYGNVNEEHLGVIFSRIHHDEVYQAHKVGGTRFMFHLAQKDYPDLKVRGRLVCDVCDAIYRRPEIVETVRERLKKEGVVKAYKEYIDQRGVPNVIASAASK